MGCRSVQDGGRVLWSVGEWELWLRRAPGLEGLRGMLGSVLFSMALSCCFMEDTDSVLNRCLHRWLHTNGNLCCHCHQCKITFLMYSFLYVTSSYTAPKTSPYLASNLTVLHPATLPLGATKVLGCFRGRAAALCRIGHFNVLIHPALHARVFSLAQHSCM